MTLKEVVTSVLIQRKMPHAVMSGVEKDLLQCHSSFATKQNHFINLRTLVSRRFYKRRTRVRQIIKVCYDQKRKKKKVQRKPYRDQKLTKKKNLPESTHSLVYYCLGFENVLECESMLRIKPL